MTPLYQTNRDWERIAQSVVKPQQIALVIGASDVGKSTFCRFLVEQGLSCGLRVGFVDADVGQSQIGPPTTIGLKIVSQSVDEFRDEPDSLYFVGSISPEHHLLQCVTGTRLMVDTAKKAGADFIVVDTTGYIEKVAAIVLKQHKIEILMPNHLIGIHRAGELGKILSGVQGLNFVQVHRLAPHKAVTSKHHDRRRKYRQSCFDEYFADCVEQPLSFDRFRGQRTPFFVGRAANQKEIEILSELSDTAVLYAEWAYRSLMVVTHESLSNTTQFRLKNHFSLADIIADVPSNFMNRVIGLVDASGKMLAIGIINAVDFRAKHLIIGSKPGAASKTKIVQFGRYRLSESRET